MHPLPASHLYIKENILSKDLYLDMHALHIEPILRTRD